MKKKEREDDKRRDMDGKELEGEEKKGKRREGREEMIDRLNSDIQLSPSDVFTHSTMQPLCHISCHVLFFHLIASSCINATHTHMHHLITPQHNTLGHE